MLQTPEEEFNKNVGFRLMNLRQSYKMSQESLGASLGVRYQQVQKYESGKIRIPLINLAKCAKLFAVPLDYMFYGEEVDPNSGYSKTVLNVAEEISKIPSLGLRRAVYNIAKEANNLAENDDDNERLSA